MNEQNEIIDLLNDTLKPIQYNKSLKELYEELKISINEQSITIYDIETVKDKFELVTQEKPTNINDYNHIYVIKYVPNGTLIKITVPHIRTYHQITINDMKIVNVKQIEKIVYE